MTKDDLVLLIEDDKIFADWCLNVLVDVYGLVQDRNSVEDGILFKIICDRIKLIDDDVVLRTIQKVKEKKKK